MKYKFCATCFERRSVLPVRNDSSICKGSVYCGKWIKEREKSSIIAQHYDPVGGNVSKRCKNKFSAWWQPSRWCSFDLHRNSSFSTQINKLTLGKHSNHNSSELETLATAMYQPLDVTRRPGRPEHNEMLANFARSLCFCAFNINFHLNAVKPFRECAIKWSLAITCQFYCQIPFFFTLDYFWIFMIRSGV